MADLVRITTQLSRRTRAALKRAHTSVFLADDPDLSNIPEWVLVDALLASALEQPDLDIAALLKRRPPELKDGTGTCTETDPVRPRRRRRRRFTPSPRASLR